MIVVVEHATPIVLAGALAENVGIETLGGTFTTILAAGSSVPCERTETFSTATDGQPHVAIRLFRGTSSTVSKAYFLGELRATGFPAASRGIPKIPVTFRVIEDRIEIAVPDPLELTPA